MVVLFIDPLFVDLFVTDQQRVVWPSSSSRINTILDDDELISYWNFEDNQIILLGSVTTMTFHIYFRSSQNQSIITLGVKLSTILLHTTTTTTFFREIKR